VTYAAVLYPAFIEQRNEPPVGAAHCSFIRGYHYFSVRCAKLDVGASACLIEL